MAGSLQRDRIRITNAPKLLGYVLLSDSNEVSRTVQATGEGNYLELLKEERYTTKRLTMTLTGIDLIGQFLTVILALSVSFLALGTLVVGRRLITDASVRAVLRRAAVVTLRDPNIVFDRHADRDPKTREILVPFERYKRGMRVLVRALVVALVLLALKLLLVLLRMVAASSAVSADTLLTPGP